jgi:hypothetical protein
MIFKLTTYRSYFALNIHQRINERQHRNSLNINHLFPIVLSQGHYTDYTTTAPKVNNGLYHHIGKTHSKYPKQ